VRRSERRAVSPKLGGAPAGTLMFPRVPPSLKRRGRSPLQPLEFDSKQIISAKPHRNFYLLRAKQNGAGEENRTPVNSLEGCRSTIELHPPDQITVNSSQMTETAIIVC
jgi:hypothetical protein